MGRKRPIVGDRRSCTLERVLIVSILAPVSAAVLIIQTAKSARLAKRAVASGKHAEAAMSRESTVNWPVHAILTRHPLEKPEVDISCLSQVDVCLLIPAARPCQVRKRAVHIRNVCFVARIVVTLSARLARQIALCLASSLRAGIRILFRRAYKARPLPVFTSVRPFLPFSHHRSVNSLCRD